MNSIRSLARFVRRIPLPLALLLLAGGCAPNATDDDFRAGERPGFERRIPAAEVDAILASGGRVLDVRLREDYEANPVLVSGAEYRDPELMSEWVSEIEKVDAPVIVYCAAGKWVSQKVASRLDARGIEVYSLEGGIEAWQESGRPVTASE